MILINICLGCAKFPFCEDAPKECCSRWIKKSLNTKLVKVDRLNYKFERIDDNERNKI